MACTFTSRTLDATADTIRLFQSVDRYCGFCSEIGTRVALGTVWLGHIFGCTHMRGFAPPDLQDACSGGVELLRKIASKGVAYSVTAVFQEVVVPRPKLSGQPLRHGSASSCMKPSLFSRVNSITAQGRPLGMQLTDGRLTAYPKRTSAEGANPKGKKLSGRDRSDIISPCVAAIDLFAEEAAC
jgi:hypothetical protein